MVLSTFVAVLNAQRLNSVKLVNNLVRAELWLPANSIKPRAVQILFDHRSIKILHEMTVSISTTCSWLWKELKCDWDWQLTIGRQERPTKAVVSADV